MDSENNAGDIISRILLEECDQDMALMKLVLNRGKKPEKVVAIRQRVLQRLRSEVWQHSNFAGGFLHQRERPKGDWISLSFPQIAQHLGGCHSAWVKMNNKLQEAAKQHSLDFTSFLSHNEV